MVAAGIYICLGGFIALVLGVVVACELMERKYRIKHPPDGWDGMREERFDDEDHHRG